VPRVSARPSEIADQGVFASERIAAGEVACKFRLLREVPKEAPWRPGLDERPEHCPLIDGSFYLVDAPERHLNHSCNPNAYLRFGAHGLDVVARRDIPAGSELTIDYLINNSGGESWPCNCGAPRCRGETGFSYFGLPAEIQREYYPLLAPWFVKRHARKLKDLGSAARRPARRCR
jgi:SET domain-containing protein